MDVTLSYAYELVLKGLEDLRTTATETADETRAIELDRLDMLTAKLTKKLNRQRIEITRGDGTTEIVENPDEETIKTMLKIQERRARLLGLDAPQEIVGAGGGPIQVANVGAGDELLARVDKLVERLNAGESPEAVAASIRASATVVEDASGVEIQHHPSSNGVAPS